MRGPEPAASTTVTSSEPCTRPGLVHEVAHNAPFRLPRGGSGHVMALVVLGYLPLLPSFLAGVA